MAEQFTPQRSLAAGAEIFGIAMRNMQAVSAAQQQMLEGIGQCYRQQTHMADSMLRQARPGGVGAQPTDVAARIESFKTALQEAQASVHVLSELMLRSTGEVATTLQTRLYAALDEVKTLVQGAEPAAAPAAAAASPMRKPAPIAA